MMMTRPDEVKCLHEPFMECFYFGPERMAERYTNGMNEERRVASGFSESTYYTVMEKIRNECGEVSSWSSSLFLQMDCPFLSGQ